MKVGDLVMFSDIDNRYARWFYGEFGIVESAKKSHCRVRWNRLVEYHGRMASVSDFHQDRFTIVR